MNLNFDILFSKFAFTSTCTATAREVSSRISREQYYGQAAMPTFSGGGGVNYIYDDGVSVRRCKSNSRC
jgi:hypothetical protein